MRVLALIGIIAIGIPVNLLGGVVLRDLWRWFAVPLGAHPLAFWNAVGLLSLVGVFNIGRATAQPDGSAKDEWWAHPVHTILVYALGYLASWGFGSLWAHIGGLA